MDTEVELVMSERQGVEIDYCPTCRGVWLDRGELDKILDRAATATEAQVPTRSAADPLPTYDSRYAYDSRYGPPGDDTPRYGAAREDTPPHGTPRFDARRYDDHDQGYGDPRYRDDRGRPYKKKRKESWLGDILDFG
nr:zf-TFIIB domain-containing protein [Cellulomonas fimi]